MDRLLKIYLMDNFVMLTSHEQLVETVLHIDQWTEGHRSVNTVPVPNKKEDLTKQFE